MSTLGERLRQGRDAKGLSLQAVSNATKIREHILVSLESDTYTALPAPVFVRGFLRTLARHLSLNSEELLALYAAVTSPAEAPEPEIEPAKLHPPKIQPIKVQPVKLQPSNGNAQQGRFARALSKNGHSAETPPPTNGHLPDTSVVESGNGHAKTTLEPARSNGHHAYDVEAARSNGSADKALKPSRSNGHHQKDAAQAPSNDHVAAEPAPRKTPASGHLPKSPSSAAVAGNGHSAKVSLSLDPLKRLGVTLKTVKVPTPALAHPSKPQASPTAAEPGTRPTLTLVRPSWMTANVMLSALTGLLLIVGVAWGGGQVWSGLQRSQSVKQLQQVQPTIAALIQPEPTATPEVTLIPTQAPTPAPAVMPPALSVTPAPVLRTLELKLDATARTWIKVEWDGAAAFQGFLESGDSKSVIAHNRVTLRAGNAGGLNVTVNGKLIGLLGSSGDVVDKQWVFDDAGAVASVPPVWANPPVAAGQ